MQFQSGCTAATGGVEAVGGWAVTGGWKCGWGWCWGMGMPLGRVRDGVLGGGGTPPFQAMPCPLRS